MKRKPIAMEDYFIPGFKVKPSVHVGSQSLDLFSGIPEEQAWEGVHLAGASGNDITVVRNIDPTYLKYWKRLIHNVRILNLTDSEPGKFLTHILLESKKHRDWIRNNMIENSTLMVFSPTILEQKLAEQLGIPLHGSPMISELYGTKSGIRKLAEENNIQMAPGYVCTTYKEAQQAVDSLKKHFDYIIVKHDFSVSGYYSKKFASKDLHDIKEAIENLTGKPLIERKDVFVVEGWIKTKASLCAQIEIIKGKEPFICAGWQQVIASDGISYMGASPLILSHKALQSFIIEVNKLAQALMQKGAIGSFGPDFLITADDETNIEADICMLIELNARVPYTAFPLEVIKQVKGAIGSGFYTKHIHVTKSVSFKDIEEVLKREKLLITERGYNIKGVIPFNIGLLPWNTFDVVIVADSWRDTIPIINKVDNLFT